MLRPGIGQGFLILKKDLENGTVKVQTNKLFITEYWIYRHRPLKKSLIILSNSTKEKLEKETDMYLHCIIASSHVVDKHDGRIFVQGVKFDNLSVDKKPSNDLDDYLRKTGRK